MGSFVPRTTSSEFRKRRNISLDGRVPGVLYSRQRQSQRPAEVPIDQSASAAGVPQTYMTFHPDAYEPHPGEPIIRDVHYTPYQTETPRFAPDELHGQEPNAAHARLVGPEIDSHQATFLRLRWLNDRLSQPAPDVIPAEHDIDFEGPSGPTLDIPIDQVGPIDAIWSRFLVQPSYDATLMSGEFLDLALRQAIDPLENPDPVFGDELTIDGVALGLDGMVGSDDTATDVTCDTPSLGPDSFLADCSVCGPGSLDQIVDELGSLAPEPDPMMRDRLYEDEMLMDPWMMPGMGPMLPGLGPMGPMGPLGPIM